MSAAITATRATADAAAPSADGDRPRGPPDTTEGNIAVHGVGYETAGQRPMTAGDNPHRLRSGERSFAALFGSCPIKADSPHDRPIWPSAKVTGAGSTKYGG